VVEGKRERVARIGVGGSVNVLGSEEPPLA
jgi:hypothetical protein